MAGLRAVCVHGHFYQPPRDDPWLGIIEPQPSAFPDRDWNARITRECYAATAAARILDAHGRLVDVLNCYEWIGFNAGPTLVSWLAAHAPHVLAAMRDGDARAVARTGHGSAWAQAYGHPILPLCSPRDAATQVRWGARDFAVRFGRAPDGMWLPEMAVDVPALHALAAAGVTLTMLAPHQARRVRPLGGGEDAWQPVAADSLDVRRVYRCRVPGGAVDVVFRDAQLSHDLSFGGLLSDGLRLAARLRDAIHDEGRLVVAAVDGETWGHHHRFGEMALAYALRLLREDAGVSLMPPAAFRERHPATWEVELWERTAWSCAHGVDRWRSDCGCHVCGSPGWTQAWRAPLRQAIDWLRDELALRFQAEGTVVLRDPWGARDRYVDVLLAPERLDAFLAAERAPRPTARRTLAARRCLEMARHALLMQTSCGWFFDDLSNIETLQVLRHAARALELAAELGARLEDDFVQRLEPARSNVASEGDGAAVWRRRVRGPAARPARVAATSAMLALLDRVAPFPGYHVRFSAPAADGRLTARASVTETSTGATCSVDVSASQDGTGEARCVADGEPFTMVDLFAVQREHLLASVSRHTLHDARSGRHAALARVRPMLDALLGDGVLVPEELAVVLGWEEAEAIAHAMAGGDPPLSAMAARAANLRRHGVAFPARFLGDRLARLLERHVAALPEGAEAALGVLDLADGTGASLDTSAAQTLALAWWKAAPAEVRSLEAVQQLGERLRLSPDVP